MSIVLKLVQINALGSKPTTVALQNATRSFATRVSATKIADIEKKLGFPEKPKRPLMPFLRFTKDLRPTLNVGNRKVTEVISELAVLWRNADASKKAAYQQQYDRDAEKYKKALDAYKSKITDEQVAQRKVEVELLKASAQRKQENEVRRATEKELGKPKRPMSGFFLFVSDLREKSPSKLTVKDTSAKWNALTEAERKVFIDQAAKLTEKYRQALAQWQEKMMRAGHLEALQEQRPTKQEKKKAESKAKPAKQAKPAKPAKPAKSE